MGYSKLQLERKSNGLCILCGKPAVVGILFCESCCSIHNERSKKIRGYRKANNLCLDCGGEKDRPKFTRCSKCAERQHKSFAKLVASRHEKGLCRCGNPATIGKVCNDCWFKRESQFNTGSKHMWQAIKQLLEKQEYKCAYSGRHLIPGVNASLDHIVPIAKSGSNDITNLQWVDKQINTRMKFGLSHQEFMSLIHQIISYTDSMGSIPRSPRINSWE